MEYHNFALTHYYGVSALDYAEVLAQALVFKISANENTLWTLAAMLDFRSAPKTKFLYMTIQ
jgi:hypothetical protein